MGWGGCAAGRAASARAGGAGPGAVAPGVRARAGRGCAAEREPGGLVGSPVGGAARRGVDMQEDRFLRLPCGKVFTFIGAEGRGFRNVAAAWRAHKAHLAPLPSARKELAASEYDRRLQEFYAARAADDGSDRRVMERHVSHLLVATWTMVTGLRAFVVNDFARADVVFCLKTKPEAY